ncbi:MAG: DUF5009 domain-containing protein [Alistipes sp.]
MEQRAYTVDLLRGLAIVGMVLSGQILWHADLPAWLFHAQTPPPLFQFDPSVPGITWVDLVFPFFLFSMGAALPLSLRRKLDIKGESLSSITFGILKRWGLLVLFAIALANLRSGVTGSLPAATAAVLQIVCWGCFCMLFMRLSRLSNRANRIMSFVGAVGLLILLLAEYSIGDLPVSVHQSDIIILVLANMVLFGSLIWLLTRNNLLLRLGVLALLAALRLGSEVESSWNEALWNWSPVEWLFRFDYLKYLCIIIPGTIVGDCIYTWMQRADSANDNQPSRQKLAILVMLILLFTVNMWGLFVRQLSINFGASILLGALLYWLLRRDGTSTGRLHQTVFSWGFFWLILGLAMEAFEGGIKKDHATFSYFFVTSGLASIVIVAASLTMRWLHMRFSILVKCGQNPMVAYTAAGFILMPVLTLLHLAPYLQTFAEWHPWLGVARGVIVTAAVMCITVIFTNKRLFWRT